MGRAHGLKALFNPTAATGVLLPLLQVEAVLHDVLRGLGSLSFLVSVILL